MDPASAEGLRDWVPARCLFLRVSLRKLRFIFIGKHPVPTSHSTWKWVDVYLDNQGATTFLIEERGRQHLLAAATGLSAEKPVRIPYRGSSRFALLFPLAPNVESFRYEAVLAYRWGPTSQQVDRVQIKGSDLISLADFR